MALEEDLIDSVRKIFREPWTFVDARVVPETKNIVMGNHGKKLEAAVLYADIDESTKLVESYSAEFCGEIYKAFLRCCSKIIRSQGGEIRAFDGDRVMGLFKGKTPCTAAATAALKVNWAVKKIINPAITSQYPSVEFRLKHTCGIDYSELMATRTGIRDNSDLVWVGAAANNAAKLNSLSSDYPTWITQKVYSRLLDRAKYGGEPRRSMWEKRIWTP